MSHQRIYDRFAILAMIFTLCLVTQVKADISLPSVFNSNMVLQRGLPIKVWGHADAAEKITVNFGGKSVSTLANAQGKWQVKLPAQKENAKGQNLTLAGKNKIQLTNILIGDVWICSGQSNMQWALSSSNNAQQEIADANRPQIRLFKVRMTTSSEPREDCEGTWEVCMPDTARSFSGVGYFFGRNLQQHLNVPIGLIGTYWGGTVAEAWTSHEALSEAMTDFDASIKQLKTPTPSNEAKIRKHEEKLKVYKAGLNRYYDLEDDKKAALAYANPNRDFSKCKPIPVPGKWEQNGYPKLDGILWYYKTIDVPQAWAGKKLAFMPGAIDEIDQTFFNGIYVDGKGNCRKGDTSFWNISRNYTIPGNLVKAGKNLIAMRVFDAVGDGGPWGTDPSEMYITLANGSTDQYIPLAGTWLSEKEYTIPEQPRSLTSPNRPGVLFNAMINPLVGFGIKGAIWYQGESNASRAKQYQTLMPTLIKDWRDRWEQGDFTFLIVSLANFRKHSNQPVARSSWAELREAQSMTADNHPMTGLAMTIDIGNATNIHPKNKQDVGYRLSLQAREIAYHEKLVASGPTYQSMKIKGKKIILTFDNVGKGLRAKDGRLTGFEICGADNQYLWADATLKGKTVLLTAGGIKKPVNARYAWQDNPVCNLYNKEGLPAVPFRTKLP